MALIDRLKSATFKGVEFLVETSSINFGQKTVVHNYPNSDRTEIEFLGQSEDIFTLELYINSVEDNYIGQRNLLKQTLAGPEIGLFVHPYEGEIRCAVVGKVDLREDDVNFGLARFSVTFQKSSPQLFPIVALNNVAKIRELYLQLKSVYKNKVIDEYFFEDFLPDNFTTIKQTLQALNVEFEIIKSLKPLEEDNEIKYNASVDKFNDEINDSTGDATTLADNLDNVITNLDNLAVSDLDNINLYQEIYEFGGQETRSPELTVQARIINNNFSLISNYINIMALGLSYNIIALIDFETDLELAEFETLLEAQYNFVFDNMDSEISFIVNQLRNEITKFFDNQSVRRVITKEVPANPLVKLTYLLYENNDDYEQIFQLNDRLAPFVYEGDIKVLTVN